MVDVVTVNDRSRSRNTSTEWMRGKLAKKCSQIVSLGFPSKVAVEEPER